MSKKTAATAKFVFSDPGHCIAFGFGAGLTPRIPGTAGTLIAFPLYYAAQFLPLPAQWLLLAILIPFGAWLCARSGKALQKHDDGGIVIDEVAACYGVLLLTPPALEWQFAAFILFRLFDSLKPPPINWLDKNIHGGWGVMLDDIAAAVFCVIILQAAQHYLPIS